MYRPLCGVLIEIAQLRYSYSTLNTGIKLLRNLLAIAFDNSADSDSLVVKDSNRYLVDRRLSVKAERWDNEPQGIQRLDT